MKILGEKIEGANIEEIIIPRGETQIVLRAQAVLDDTEFNDLCPRPKPVVGIGKGGIRIERTDDPGYKANLDAWGEKRVAWLVLKSLEATESLEWETVDYNDQSTWLNYKEELKESGFSDAEQGRILSGVMAANGLSESKVEEARARFLRSREVALAASWSPPAAPGTTPSGGPANGSA
jgi:hypothetical protein